MIPASTNAGESTTTTASTNFIDGFGFIHGYMPEGNDAKITKFRVKAWTTTPVGMYVDIDARADGNELQQFWLYKKYSWAEVRMGRVFLSGCYSTPPPFLSRTARYPNAAFAMSAYATGIQISKKIGNWSILTDVTGSSATTYKSAQFDRLESSARVQRTGENGKFVAGTYQISGDFIRLAVDGGFKIGITENFVALYHTDEHVVRQTAVLANTEVNASTHFKPHLQYDARQNGKTVYTAGIGIGSIKSWYLAIDREFGDSDAVVARVQYKFVF